MKMYKLLIIIMILFITLNFNININATMKESPNPIAKIYKEGIYHFENSIGNRITFKLVNNSVNANILIFEDDELKYYFNLTEKCPQAELILNGSIKTHTAILIGEGQVAFTFEY